MSLLRNQRSTKWVSQPMPRAVAPRVGADLSVTRLSSVQSARARADHPLLTTEEFRSSADKAAVSKGRLGYEYHLEVFDLWLARRGLHPMNRVEFLQASLLDFVDTLMLDDYKARVSEKTWAALKYIFPHVEGHQHTEFSMVTRAQHETCASSLSHSGVHPCRSSLWRPRPASFPNEQFRCSPATPRVGMCLSTGRRSSWFYAPEAEKKPTKCASSLLGQCHATRQCSWTSLRGWELRFLQHAHKIQHLSCIFGGDTEVFR